jgi:hypothetical protein
MSKRLLISEEEKKEIKKLYKINEGWLDDTISYLKSTGEDAYEFIKDKLDIDDESDEKIDDKNISKSDKEKIQSDISDIKSKDIDISGEEKIAAKELFEKLNSKLNNEKLSVAIVANAAKESSLNCKAKGDGPPYALKHPDKNVGGFCSFGLWQYNICGGLGIDLVKKHGYESLGDCDKQIDFMVNHVQKKIPGNKSIKGYVDWFVDTIEKPTDREGAKKKRNQWAANNLGTFNLDVDSIHS